jgi:hypothetical protein
MVKDSIKINDAISYKVYNRKDLTNKLWDEEISGNVTHIYPVGCRDKEMINGFLKHVKKIDVDFKTEIILFFIDYSSLPAVSPPIHDEEIDFIKQTAIELED